MALGDVERPDGQSLAPFTRKAALAGGIPIWRRYPSSFGSCSQASPPGGAVALVGLQGRMKRSDAEPVTCDHLPVLAVGSAPPPGLKRPEPSRCPRRGVASESPPR